MAKLTLLRGNSLFNLDFHKSITFRICISSKSLKILKPSKLKKGRMSGTLGTKRSKLKSLLSNKNMRPKRKSGKKSQSNSVIIFLIQGNLCLLSIPKKWMSGSQINWFTNVSSGDFLRTIALTEAISLTDTLKSIKMQSKFSWTSLICLKENNPIKIQKKFLKKVWHQPNLFCLINLIMTFFKNSKAFRKIK